ncbi:hypothetical protein [Devosia sp. SL43]|uniref:hypothetical protein n=1 Tax=Devosia sp. SL43 TaxID=2806348 RepID=UPI001F431A13|nr:hypothetical protein [Devosia sp. SL43]UJW85497.1 hypothetical protein IM737_19210 [Devosia sp. SL43]
MFTIVRSVFWLTAAYMVIKPGVDLPDANALAIQAMAAGTQVVAEQVSNIECDSFQCIGGKAVVATALQTSPSVGLPMHETPTSVPVPYPRPRLDRAG